MRKLFFVFVLSLIAHANFAQALPDYDAIKLDVKEGYNATADDAALKASNFLLSTAIEKDNLPRLKSMQYVIKWMMGTPHYSFSLEEKATKFAKNNSDLLALYMAAMTKFALENKADAKDQAKLSLNAVRIIIAYAKDENNKVKIKSELKKMIAADEKGQLEEYLNK